MPCPHDDQRAGSFLKQLISMALQIGNAACVLGTVSDTAAFEKILTFSNFVINLYIIAGFSETCFYRSMGRVTGIVTGIMKESSH